MAVIHIKNIHNHKIKTRFRNEPLPPYFDGYVDTETGKIIDPVSNVDTFLQSVKDEVDDTVNKLAGFEDTLSCTVTVAQVDTRLEEVECRITNLVTCANSKKTVDLGSFGPVYDEKCLHKTDGKPVEFFATYCCLPVKVEPGLYLGQMPGSQCMCTSFPIGDNWTYCWSSTGQKGSSKDQMGMVWTDFHVVICYKNKYCFRDDYSNFIYEIDEESAKKSYVEVTTSLRATGGSVDKVWLCQINKPYACVKDCFEDFAKCSINLTSGITRLQ